MKINFNNKINNLYQNNPCIRPFFEDCLEINATKDKLHQHVFFLLMHNGSTYIDLKKAFPEMTNEELTDCLDKMINLVGIDVNQPCWAGNQDLMYHAMRYGTVEDVAMLLKNGYDGSNLMSKRSMYNEFKADWNIDDTDKKLEKLKSFGIGDYKLRNIKENLEKAKQLYVSELNLSRKLEAKALNREPNEQATKKDVDWFAEHFESQFKDVNSLVAELDKRSDNYDEKIKLMRNQKVVMPYKKPSKNADLMDAIIKPFVSLNKEKATSTLFAKLIELNCSLEDIIEIFNGNIYSAKEENQLHPAFKKLLDSEGLKNPFESDYETEPELE